MVGPIVGIALIAAAVLWRRRRSSRRKGGLNEGRDDSREYPQYQPVQQQVAEKHSVVRPAELASEHQLSELPTSRY